MEYKKIYNSEGAIITYREPTAAEAYSVSSYARAYDRQGIEYTLKTLIKRIDPPPNYDGRIGFLALAYRPYTKQMAIDGLAHDDLKIWVDDIKSYYVETES